MAAKIHLLLADDHAVVRTGLRLLLETQPDMAVVSEASSGEEAVRCAERANPHVVILDLSMPGGGIESIRRIRERAPRARVVVLTMHDDRAYVREAFSAGAAGYVVKRAADRDLLAAIRTVAAGHSYVDVDLADALGGHDEDPRERLSRELSDRELQVLQLLARGFTNVQIAQQLAIGIKTAETYRTRLRRKLGLESRADIVDAAIEAGLLPKR
jgi:DNA-binding NarL/FixJ family response regulator